MTVITWCIDHWELVLAVVLVITSVVVALLKKKPVSDVASAIYSSCLMAVQEAEKTDYKGDKKLQFAVDLVSTLLHAKWPDLDVSKYISIIVKTIETILSTPQKKGEN